MIHEANKTTQTHKQRHHERERDVWHVRMYLSLRFWKNRCKDLLLAMGISALWVNRTRKPIILLPFLISKECTHGDARFVHTSTMMTNKFFSFENTQESCTMTNKLLSNYYCIPCLILDNNSSPWFGRREPGRPSPPPSAAAIFMRSSACRHGHAPKATRN